MSPPVPDGGSDPAARTDGQGIEITVRDLATGETESRVIWDDYVVICAGNRYIHHVQAHVGGTHVVAVGKEAADG